MRIAAEDLSRPAAEGTRKVALALLAEADEAAARLRAGADGEALHDFRVALRRLRSTLRFHRPWLGGAVRRRHERRLGRIARATGAARDAEVQLAWLAGQRPALTRGEAPGLAWLSRRLAARLPAGAEGYGRVLARHDRLARKLRTRLALTAEGEASGGPFGLALAGALRARASAFLERMDAVRDAADVAAAHAARIEGKRLRYLLEPLRGTRGADARRVVARLKRVQELLGELHDAHVLEAELRACLAEVAGERARRLAPAPGGDPAPGLRALARLARARRDDLFAGLEAERRRGVPEAVAREVEALAAALERGARARAERPPPRPRVARAARARSGS